jgi:hypothetical protein
VKRRVGKGGSPLCALIPPPRHPLIRFHGVLAPNSAWRKEVVPRPQTVASDKADEPQESPSAPLNEIATERAWGTSRLDWATLLKRVYNIDALASPCGGRLTFIELIESKREAVAQLTARGLPVEHTFLPQSPPPSNTDHVDGLPVEDWHQSTSAPGFVPDPTWDDP